MPVNFHIREFLLALYYYHYHHHQFVIRDRTMLAKQPDTVLQKKEREDLLTDRNSLTS